MPPDKSAHVYLSKEAFQELEAALTADLRFSDKEHFPCLVFFTPDSKRIRILEKE